MFMIHVCGMGVLVCTFQELQLVAGLEQQIFSFLLESLGPLLGIGHTPSLLCDQVVHCAVLVFQLCVQVLSAHTHTHQVTLIV